MPLSEIWLAAIWLMISPGTYSGRSVTSCMALSTKACPSSAVSEAITSCLSSSRRWAVTRISSSSSAVRVTPPTTLKRPETP